MIDRLRLEQIIREQQLEFANQPTGIIRAVELQPHTKSLSQVSIVTGVRRSGKSTLLRQMRDLLAPKNPSFFYLRFDDPRLSRFEEQDFELALMIWLEMYSPPSDALRVFLFDEIQNVIGWEKWADHFSQQKNTKLIVTGSNSRILSSELSTFLTGRHLTLHLTPFSFCEVVNSEFGGKIQSPPHTTEESVQLRRLYKHYELFGGFPRVFIDQNTALLPELYEDIIVRDISRHARRANPQSINDLGQILISESSRLFNRSKVTALIGVTDPVTVGRYCQLFKDAFLFSELRQYSPSLRKRLRSHSKFYAVDHALVSQVASSVPSSTILEHIVANELLREKNDLFYWHSEDGYEVDFLCVHQRKVQRAVQVCTQLGKAETREREVRALRAAAEELKVSELEIVTNDEREIIEDKKVKIIVRPCWEWLLSRH